MKTIQEQIETAKAEINDTIETINKERRASKGSWYTYFGVCNGKSFKVKAFGTWIQRLEIELPDRTVSLSGPMDISVKEYKERLETLLLNTTKLPLD